MNTEVIEAEAEMWLQPSRQIKFVVCNECIYISKRGAGFGVCAEVYIWPGAASQEGAIGSCPSQKKRKEDDRDKCW